MSPVRVFIKFVLQKLVLEHEQALYFRGFLPHPPGGGGGTPIQYLYGYVPPNGVVILKLLI